MTDPNDTAKSHTNGNPLSPIAAVLSGLTCIVLAVGGIVGFYAASIIVFILVMVVSGSPFSFSMILDGFMITTFAIIWAFTLIFADDRLQKRRETVCES